MKKFLISSAVAFSLFSYLHAESNEKSGVFVGVDTGYNIRFSTTSETGGTSASQTTIPQSALIGLSAGYNLYFADKIGIRGSVFYRYGGSTSNTTETEQNQKTKTNAQTSLHHVGIMVDVLYDFVKLNNAEFGIFAGVGVGYANSKTTSVESSIKTTIQGPSGLTIPLQNRFELIANFEPIGITYTNSVNQAKETYRDINLLVAYKFNF